MYANAAESISSSLMAACAAGMTHVTSRHVTSAQQRASCNPPLGEDCESEYISIPPPLPLPLQSPSSAAAGGSAAEVAKLLQTVQVQGQRGGCRLGAGVKCYTFALSHGWSSGAMPVCNA